MLKNLTAKIVHAYNNSRWARHYTFHAEYEWDCMQGHPGLENRDIVD